MHAKFLYRRSGNFHVNSSREKIYMYTCIHYKEVFAGENCLCRNYTSRLHEYKSAKNGQLAHSYALLISARGMSQMHVTCMVFDTSSCRLICQKSMWVVDIGKQNISCFGLTCYFMRQSISELLHFMYCCSQFFAFFTCTKITCATTWHLMLLLEVC